MAAVASGRSSGAPAVGTLKSLFGEAASGLSGDVLAPPPPTHSIHGETYVQGALLGEGAFSKVYASKHPSNGAAVAIKRMTVSAESLPSVREELRIAQLVDHPHIIKCHASDIARGSEPGSYVATTVSEMCPGSLVAQMQRRAQPPSQRFSEAEVITILGSVVSALCYLHQQTPPIAHRDIKPENILIASNGTYKLCDFGSATVFSQTPRTAKDVARVQQDIDRSTTMLYRSPEMVDPWRMQRIDEKCDVWAFGVFLYYVMYFVFPFEETSLSILGGKFALPPLGGTTYAPPLLEVVRRCLVGDPDQRWSIFQLVQFVSFELPGLRSGGSVQLLPPSSIDELARENSLRNRRQPDLFEQAIGTEVTRPTVVVVGDGAPKPRGTLLSMLNWQSAGGGAGKVTPPSLPPAGASPPPPAPDAGVEAQRTPATTPSSASQPSSRQNSHDLTGCVSAPVKTQPEQMAPLTRPPLPDLFADLFGTIHTPPSECPKRQDNSAVDAAPRADVAPSKDIFATLWDNVGDSNGARTTRAPGAAW